jgi:AcrR family transcriptional regulator
VADVGLEEIAREAGVGKATLFRRFGDRQALFEALLDEHERALQDELLHGPPPLGPPADPLERLRAFADALLDLTLEHRELLLALETSKPLARTSTGAYAAWHQHASYLLGELRPRADAALLAHLLLAAFDAELLTALTRSDVAPAALRGTVRQLVDAIATAR